MRLISNLKTWCDLLFYLTFASFVGLFVGNWVINIALGLPPLLILAIGTKRKYRSEEIQYSDKFFAFTLMFLFLLSISFTFRSIGDVATAEIFTLDGPHIFARTSLPLGLMFVPSAILLMRLSRHDTMVLEQPAYKRLTLTAFFGILVCGWLVTTPPILSVLDRLLSEMIRLIFFPIAWVWALFIPEFERRREPPIFWGVEPATGRPSSELSPEEYLMYFLLGEEMSREARERFIWTIVGISVIVMVFLLLRILSKKSLTEVESSENEDGLAVERVDLETVKKRTKKKRLHTGNEIREVYGKFLELSQRRGVRIQRSTTSLEVAQDLDDPRSDALRELYVKVRYGMQSHTKAEVLQAKKILKELKEEN